MPFNRSPPTGRTGHVAVSYKGYVFVWGGYKEHENDDVNSYFSPLELAVYCAMSEKWDIKSCSADDGPSGMSGSTASIVGDSIYLFGGYSQDLDGSLNHLYRLPLMTYKWERLHPTGPAPFSVDKTSSWEYDQKFYIFGGFGSPAFNTTTTSGFQFVFDQILWKGWTNQFYEYDPDKNEWSIPKFSGVLPLPRAAHAAAVVRDKVYIFGGRLSHRRMNDLHCFNTQTMTWSGELTLKSPVPEGRSWHSFTAMDNGRILLYGGFSHDNRALSDCWLLDPENLTWQQIWLSFNKPRLWHSASLTQFGEVIIFGGCSSNILQLESRNRLQANEIVVITVTPRSLLRLCIDRVGELRGLVPLWCTLPQSLQAILNLRYCSVKATGLDGS